MRALGIDYGARRLGFALSDATGTLATPWRVVERPPSEPDTVQLVCAEIARLAAEDDGLATVVVGWPRRLDGSATAQTAVVEAFARAVARDSGVPVVLQDERLSSVEAESLLARRESDWRARKRRLDAAAAAVVLQDYLDAQPRG